MSQVPVINTLSRGQSGQGAFPVSVQEDLRIAYLVVSTIPDRDAIPEWKRLPYMVVRVIDTNTDYMLGPNITIAGQVWAVKSYGVPANVVTEDEIFGLDGYILPQKIQNIFLNTQYIVGSEGEMFGPPLVTTTGNFVIRTDTNNIYIKLNNTNPGTIGDFALASSPGTVISVNGQSGVVVITVASLLAVPANLTSFNAAVEGNTIVLGHGSAIADLQNDIIAVNQDIADLDSYTSTHLGTKELSSILQNPTNTHLGWSIVWDGTRFTLSSIAGDDGVLSSDDILEGAVNKYFTEARVRATVLTGLPLAQPLANVTASDSVLQALGKLQDFTSFLNNNRLPIDGSIPMTGVLQMGGYRISGLLAAITNDQAVTLGQLIAAIDGLKPKDDVTLATTSALPAYTAAGLTLTADANGAFPNQDGVALLITESLLVKDESGADKIHNGIYELTDAGSGGTPWILTRRADSDTGIELQGAFVQVISGTTNINTAWIQYATDVTLGTTDLLWRQISSSVPDATPTTKGKAKLYNTLGSNADGAIDQNITTRAIQDAVSLYGVAAGTDTYTVTLTPTLPALVAGQQFKIKFTNGNTGASTINIDGLGAIPLKKNVNADLIAADISAEQILNVAYDGTNFQIVGGSVAVATDTVAGVTKVYNALGSNVDGTINQDVITDELALKELLANKATGTGAFADSDVSYPSEKKVKANLDALSNLVAGIGRLVGGWNSASLPTTGFGGGIISAGDYWKITGTVTITGIGDLKSGDTLVANIDNASVAAEFFALQSNVDQATNSVLGLVKLYTDLTASNTDGSPTQAIVKQATVINSQYQFYLLTTVDQDIWLNASTITQITKGAGVATASYKINNETTVPITFTVSTWAGTPIVVPANAVLTWTITYTGGFSSASLTVVHSRNI